MTAAGSPFELQNKFTVAGERFKLDPAQIAGVYPASGAIGSFGTCLPHLLLRRTTLPWERSPFVDGGEAAASWMALLVLAEALTPPLQSVSAETLETASSASPWHPAYAPEEGQSRSDVVTVVDLPVALVTALVPQVADLQLLAHVRQGLDAADDPVSQQAVVLGSGLIPEPGRSTVLLVSLEGRYTEAGFDLQGAQPDDLIRLVVLNYWTLTSDPASLDFGAMMERLSRSDLSPTIPAGASPSALARLEAGFVALPFSLRDGSQLPTWYRGPLLCGNNTGELPVPLPVLSSDALLSYDPATVFFDVSYASAWALGRTLMLASPVVAGALYGWKLARAQAASLRAALPLRPHLRTSLGRRVLEDAELPSVVAAWLTALAGLANIPFSYLVPDPGMLPPEAIRFFTLDARWLAALFDGALSIGRVTSADRIADADIPIPAGLLRPVTGFIMRSAVAAAFPSLSVRGYETDPTVGEGPEAVPLAIRRQALLAADVLLCLFDGTIEAVDIEPTPDVLHSGVDQSSDDPSSDELFKMLRDPATGEIEPGKTVSPLPWRGDLSNKVLDFSKMRADMAEALDVASMANSGFALQMVQSEFCARLLAASVEA